jgi:hypothetical protein
MMQKIEQPGIYVDFDIAAYMADPCPEPSLSQTIAKVLIERSPAHAAATHPRLAPPPEDDDEAEKYIVARAIGDAAHRFMIGRGKDIAVGEFNSWRGKDAAAFKTDALAAGRTPILDKHMVRATRMVHAAHDQIEAAGWFDAFHPDNGHGEVVIAWQEDGLWFRSMVDWMVSPTLAYDYKSTSLSCAPHAVGKLMADAGWDVQAAFQERGLDVLDPDGRGRRTFRFIAQENEPPYALTPVELTEAVLTIGRKKVAYAVAMWKTCMATGLWLGYPSEICRPEMPGYKETQWLNREIEEADRPRNPKLAYSLMGG